MHKKRIALGPVHDETCNGLCMCEQAMLIVPRLLLPLLKGTLNETKSKIKVLIYLCLPDALAGLVCYDL